MGKKIFEVYLAKEGVPNNEAYAKLDLPASPWELWDALDKVRLNEGEQLYMPKAALVASPIPAVERSLPPALRTVKLPDGIGRILSAYWMTSSCRSGQSRSWQSCRRRNRPTRPRWAA